MVCILNLQEVQEFVDSTDNLAELNQLYSIAFNTSNYEAASIVWNRILGINLKYKQDLTKVFQEPYAIIKPV